MSATVERETMATSPLCLGCGLEPGGRLEESPLSLSDRPALVLYTSGTTSRPKRVPLTHRNLLYTATLVAAKLQLRADRDLCLNLMPLYHMHALGVNLLASLAAGARLVCVPHRAGESLNLRLAFELLGRASAAVTW
jgi:acyl-CoA synthetase (AMP-forming)/AMP-acid ligase II